MRVEGTPETLWSRLRWPAVLLLAVLVYGTAGYMLTEGWSLIDAAYMTLVTLTTVGFREVRPLDGSGKIFTMSLIALGVTVLLITITVVGAWVAEGALSERRRRKRMHKQLSQLRNHFIICAYGRVGRAVVREFSAEGVPFVVIDPNQDLEEHMLKEGLTYIVGEASQEEVLREAGVERASGLVCAVDSDSTNVFIVLMARSLNPGIFIVARASESQAIDRLQQAGADRVISPFLTSGHHMALMALRASVMGYLEIAAGDQLLRLEERLVEEGSPLIGQTMSGVSGSAPLLAVRHADGQISAGPADDLQVRAGDLLILVDEGA